MVSDRVPATDEDEAIDVAERIYRQAHPDAGSLTIRVTKLRPAH